MTISEAIAKIKALKPHQFSDDIIVGWLSELDGQLYHSLFVYREDAPTLEAPYSAKDDSNITLLVPYPYDEIYTNWLSVKIDYANQEYDRYNNGMLMFNQYLNDFSAYWARNHASIDDGHITCI